jgi:hypothetical protein
LIKGKFMQRIVSSIDAGGYLRGARADPGNRRLRHSNPVPTDADIGDMSKN